jgi:hypothetical protein
MYITGSDPDVWVDGEAGPVVRPYAMTRGRTEPIHGDFDLISLVLTTRTVSTNEIGLGPEHAAIVDLCRRPHSVAEVAAYLDLPVGIVRVLLGDLLDRAVIRVRKPEPTTDLNQDNLFEAVINGLRAL